MAGGSLHQLHGLHQQDSDKLHRNELVYARTENELQSLSEYIMTSYELTYSGAESYRVEGKFDLPQVRWLLYPAILVVLAYLQQLVKGKQTRMLPVRKRY